MTINATAAGKTVLVIGAVWSIMFFDLMPHASHRSVFSADTIIRKVRESLGYATPSSDATASDSASVGMKLSMQEKHVTVSSIEPGSMADKSGVKVGDVIFALNRLSVDDVSDFEKRSKGEGDKLAIKRDGVTVSPMIVMGEVPKVLPAPEVKAPEFGIVVTDMIGMYPSGIHAPMALAPQVGSMADRAGLKPEDWILSVNGTETQTAEKFNNLVAGHGPFVLKVARFDHGKRQELTLKVDH